MASIKVQQFKVLNSTFRVHHVHMLSVSRIACGPPRGEARRDVRAEGHSIRYAAAYAQVGVQ